MRKKKKEEQTKEFCQKRMLEMCNKHPELFQPNEKIMQCKYPYPSYWFITSTSRLYSVYGKDLKLLKPTPDPSLSKPNQRKWCYGYTHPETKKKKKVRMHVILAEHFLLNRFQHLYPDLKYHIHHIIPTHEFDWNQPYECNALSNIQIIPAKLHDGIIGSLEANPNYINNIIGENEIEPKTATELYLKHCISRAIKNSSISNNTLVIQQDITDDEAKRGTKLSLLSDFKIKKEEEN